MEGRIDETESMAHGERRASLLNPNDAFHYSIGHPGMDDLDVSGNSFITVHRIFFQESKERNRKPSKYHPLSSRWQDHPCRGM
jgi:hypothetical protein